MKKLDKKLKYTLAIGASCILLTPLPFLGKEYDYKEPDYQLLDEGDQAFASLPTGKIYIGTLEELEGKDYNENDILVVDERLINNNMKIISSHRIDDKDIQNSILYVIDEYEKEHPTTWDRSIESMRIEWHAHNFFYKLNFKKSNTADVDFENNEEKFYNNEIIKRVFK